IGAVLLGFIGTPAWPWLQAKLTGEEIHAEPIFEGAGLMVLSIVLVFTGLGVGWALYGRRPRADAWAPDPLETKFPGAFAWLAAKLGIDELYAATLGRVNTFLAALASGLDRWVWGGVIAFLAWLGEFAGAVNRKADEAGINGGFDGVSESLR